MKINSKRGRASIFIIGIIFFGVVIFLFNRWLQTKVQDMAEIPPPKSQAVQTSQKRTENAIQKTKPLSPSESLKPLRGDVVKKVRVIPGSDIFESIYYVGDQAVAKIMETTEGVIEKSGEIPNGKIKVIDEYGHSSGQEYYVRGKRHGASKMYYDNGQLKSQHQYSFGELVSKKEYYVDGTLRLEVDYADARDLKGDKEVGIGKVYFYNGVLKYEWNMTNGRSEGFRKAYNREGQLRAEFYYDELGDLIRSNSYDPYWAKPIK